MSCSLPGEWWSPYVCSTLLPSMWVLPRWSYKHCLQCFMTNTTHEAHACRHVRSTHASNVLEACLQIIRHRVSKEPLDSFTMHDQRGSCNFARPTKLGTGWCSARSGLCSLWTPLVVWQRCIAKLQSLEWESVQLCDWSHMLCEHHYAINLESLDWESAQPHDWDHAVSGQGCTQLSLAVYDSAGDLSTLGHKEPGSRDFHTNNAIYFHFHWKKTFSLENKVLKRESFWIF